MASMDVREEQKKTIIVPFLKVEGITRSIPALKAPSQFNDGTGKFEPLAQVPNTPTHKHGAFKYLTGQEDLRQALIQYKTLRLEPCLSIDVDKCSWQDVFAMMESAQVADKEKTAGWKGSLRKLWGKMGEKADMSLPVLDAIPDQFGLSVVRAGISLCFLFAKRSMERRKKVYDAFEDIPAIILRTQALRARFPGNVHLENHAIESYQTLLGAITDLIALLLRPIDVRRLPFFSKRKAPILGVNELLEKVTQERKCLHNLTQDLWEDFFLAMKETGENIRDTAYRIYQISEASRVQGQKVQDQAADIHELVRKNGTTITEIHKSGKDNSSFLEALTQTTTKTDLVVHDIDERTRVMKHELMDAIQAQASDSQAKIELAIGRATLDGIDVQNLFMDFLSDALQAGSSSILQSQALARQSTSMMPPERLVNCLNVPPGHPVEDFENALHIGHDFDPVSLGQANSLLKTPQFRAWSRPNQPAFLLVNGGIEPSGSERLSAMSFLCASLIAGLVKLHRGIVCLQFYCGFHTFSRQSFTGPSGLIRSLIFQMAMELTRRGTLDLDFIDTRSFKDGIECHNLKALCETFHLLVRQLPLDTPVYCIIDGISWYETPEMHKELGYVADSLRALVIDDRLRPIFKLLMTSPYGSRDVSKGVPRNEIVSLQPEVALDDALMERMVFDETRSSYSDHHATLRARNRREWNEDEYEDDDRPEDFL